MVPRKSPAPAAAKNSGDAECPKCGGYGLIIAGDGSLSKCDCGNWDDLQYRHALEKARIPRRYRNKTLEGFESVRGDAARQEIRKIAIAYASTFRTDESHGLLLRGGTGSGKTHIAVGILREVLRRGCSCLYCNVTDLLARLRETYHQASDEREGQILAEMETVDLLVLDDLGAEAPSDWMRDRLYLVINRRYENARSIIITTNCDDAELSARIGERAVSRIHEMCELQKFPSEDYRRRMMT